MHSLNKVVLSFEVQLIVEKKSEVLPFSIDRELGSTDRKIIGIVFCRIFKQAQSSWKRLGFHLNFSTYKRETLATFWGC